MTGEAKPSEDQVPVTGSAVPADAPVNATRDDIVVTGIRASLRQSMDIKKNAVGVVDAISAEEMGKFPDTNLAEALQRITGVSIDRSNGEGSFVTVRGFGPEFNLVLLNGRQMPSSSLPSAGAPASRSFDFANLAAEGVAAVEVYKSGNVRLPTGGIGSTINILTPRPLDRPGFRATLSAKGVYDTSRFDGHPITPEVSGIISDTFADNRVGILVTGSYQKRKASVAQFSAGWREGYHGDENNWESLTNDPADPRYAQITNHPGPNDIYQVPQNAAYDFTDITRERINGQAVLQVRPFDSLTATVDYTFSQNTVNSQTNSFGVWFTGGNTTSAWTDGPAAGPLFFSEHFNPGLGLDDLVNPGKDFAITGALTKNRSRNKSLGGNIAWNGLGGLRLVLDAHHSTAESKPTSPLGSGVNLGSAIFGVEDQSVDFTHDMPVLSVTMYPGSELYDPAHIRPAGNVFRNQYMKDRIDEVAFKGGYDFDSSFIKSLDFGATYTENKVRTAYGFIQNNTWGGTLSSADTPDSLYELTNLPRDLSGMSGSHDPAILQHYYKIDVNGLVDLLQNRLGICSDPDQGTAKPGTCLADFTTDRRVRERTIAPYVQSLHEFPLFGNPAQVRLGLRYERTKISSSALVPIPTGTTWDADNEIPIIFSSGADFTTLKGKYHNWLPEADFNMEPIRNFKLRASYSHTITRPDYASMQGGLTLDAIVRVGGGTASSGNPNLLPYKSKNIDLSAEWYYGRASYASIGYFHKDVSNFIENSTINESLFGLTNPAAGPLVAEAQAALGPGAATADIRAYIVAHHPEVVNPATGGILGTAADPLVNFVVTRPSNSDQKAKLSGWEFNIQHSFWNTGFGAILNYTIVNSDTKYNNAVHYLTPQFAVTGVSDSANAVLFYDKHGIQARVAYNWRDSFLSGYAQDPFYVEAYGQWDASASYEVRRGITVFAEGINVTNADRRGHMRNNHIVFFAQPGHARYAAGVRVSFGGNPPPPPLPPPVAPLPPPAATQTCADGSVILATAACPVPPPPPPPPPPAERGERGS